MFNKTEVVDLDKQTVNKLDFLLKSELIPLVRSIDIDSFYPKDFLVALAEAGFFSSQNQKYDDVLRREAAVIKKVSSYCMTTGFVIWCHLAAITFIRNTKNKELKEKLLKSLEDGSILAGTGLSNAMKYYGGIETLYLKAEKADGGYIVSGTLPSVSNLGENHWFGAIANTDDDRRVMLFIPCYTNGITLTEKRNYLGVNGSATYICKLKNVYIKKEFVIAEDADAFVKAIRPYFLSYQVPLGLGVTEASLKTLDKSYKKNDNKNETQRELDLLWKRTRHLNNQFTNVLSDPIKLDWGEIILIRLEMVKLTLEVVHSTMLHSGGAGYIYQSAPSRRLREAYFLVNLTPTIKHLENMNIKSKIPKA